MNTSNGRMPQRLWDSRLSLLPGSACVLLSLGCEASSTVRPGHEAGRSNDSGISGQVDHEVVLPQCEPTFESIQRNIFAIACGVDACHGTAIPAWGLTLTDGPRARDRLVGKPSQSCGEFYLVSPGHPQDSFLWMKISMPRPPCGERMPYGGPPLSTWSQACIRDWIAGLGGAADARADSDAHD